MTKSPDSFVNLSFAGLTDQGDNQQAGTLVTPTHSCVNLPGYRGFDYKKAINKVVELEVPVLLI